MKRSMARDPLIETTRAFEANTKLIQYQDSMVGGLVNRILGNGQG